MHSYKNSLDKFCKLMEMTDEKLDIYLNNTINTHSSALSVTYPVVREILGNEIFASLATVYGRHYHASEWDINQYGGEFSELLKAQLLSPKKDHYPWKELSHIADIEFGITYCYYNSDHNKSILFTSTETDRVLDTNHITNLIKYYHPYVVFIGDFTIWDLIELRSNALNITIRNKYD